MTGAYSHFSKKVEDYDTVAGKVVMSNEELHTHLVDCMHFDRMQRLSVLDIGCGTGHGMRLILERFPNATVTGIDFSRRMIEKCRRKLEAFSDRIELVERDFNEPVPGGGYDAVVSAVAIHNSTHEQKSRLFRKIFSSLKPGGVFVNGDFIEGETDKKHELYMVKLKRFMEKHLSGEELETWLRHAFTEDRPMKLSRQFKLLEDIGFKEIRLKWKFNNEAVYSAMR